MKGSCEKTSAGSDFPWKKVEGGSTERAGDIFVAKGTEETSKQSPTSFCARTEEVISGMREEERLSILNDTREGAGKIEGGAAQHGQGENRIATKQHDRTRTARPLTSAALTGRKGHESILRRERLKGGKP